MQCPQCGQNVLADDALCWHCGTKLRRQKPVQAAQAESAPALSLRYIGLLSGLLVLILLGLIALAGSLRAQPLVRTRPDRPLPPNWQPVTDDGRQFTFNAPPSWQTVTAQDAAAPAFAIMQTAMTQIIPDAEPLFWGTFSSDNAVDNTAYLTIAESRRLSPLSAAEIIQFLEAALPTAELIEPTTGLFMDDRALLAWSPENGEFPLRCQAHLFVPAQRGVFFTICTAPANFSAVAGDVQTIQQSYQSLTP